MPRERVAARRSPDVDHHRTPRRRLIAALLALVAVVGVGACGGDDEEIRSLTVVGDEMSFEAPDRVQAGTYDVTFRNVGAEYHELAFRDAAGEILDRRSIAGGAEIVMRVELDAGTYELGCFEPGHYEAGMFKPLIVDP